MELRFCREDGCVKLPHIPICVHYQARSVCVWRIRWYKANPALLRHPPAVESCLSKGSRACARGWRVARDRGPGATAVPGGSVLTRVCRCTPPGNRSQQQARPRDRHCLMEGAFLAQVLVWGRETCSWGWTPFPEPSPAFLPAGLGALLHRELTLAVPGLHRPGWGLGAQVMLCPSSGGSLGSQGPGGAGKVGGGDRRGGHVCRPCRAVS